MEVGIKRKAGAAVGAVRHAGAIRTFETLNHLFQHGQMVIVGSRYWNVGIGSDAGQVKEDAAAIRTMETLGKNMAWLLKKSHSWAMNFWKAAEMTAHK